MRNFFILTLLVGYLTANAQTPSAYIPKEAEVISYHLSVSDNKTTSIIFPASIVSASMANIDLSAEKAAGVENILLVKSTVKGFSETSLTVITGDGDYYTFIVNYDQHPKTLTYNFKNLANTEHKESKNEERKPLTSVTDNKKSLIFQDVKYSQKELERFCDNISSDKKRKVKHIGQERYNIQFLLEGIYIKEDVIFYKMNIKNRSNINYDIDFIKFYIKDRQVARRSSVQENQITPIFVYSPDKNFSIKGKDAKYFVYTLPKFTIPDNKDLVVELFEKNGGRHISLILNEHEIVNAAKI